MKILSGFVSIIVAGVALMAWFQRERETAIWLMLVALYIKVPWDFRSDTDRR